MAMTNSAPSSKHGVFHEAGGDDSHVRRREQARAVGTARPGRAHGR